MIVGVWNTDCWLHALFSLMIGWLLHKIGFRVWSAMLITFIIGLCKELVDSVTHYAELLDVVANGLGLVVFYLTNKVE